MEVPIYLQNLSQVWGQWCFDEKIKLTSFILNIKKKKINRDRVDEIVKNLEKHTGTCMS